MSAFFFAGTERDMSIFLYRPHTYREKKLNYPQKRNTVFLLAHNDTNVKGKEAYSAGLNNHNQLTWSIKLLYCCSNLNNFHSQAMSDF
jgi:hypothetical protein